jgi:hypothetical protein
MADLFAERERPLPAYQPRKLLATYDYTDEHGVLLFQSLRYEPKEFRQRRPDGPSWAYDLKGVRRVLYRLPQVLEGVRQGRVVVVVEGEKDADALTERGLVATTNPMGAEKWRPEFAESLRGARVLILPDNDSPGRKHAQDIARSLLGVASTVRVVELPGLPPKGDVSDWLAAGGTPHQLKELFETAPEFSVEQSLAKVSEPNNGDGPPVRRRYRTLREVLADPEVLNPPRAVVPRLAWAGRVVLLAAREKAGKSTFAGQAAAALSAGGTFLGERLAEEHVLWLGLEEHIGDTARRFADMGANPDNLTVAEAPETLAELEAWVADVRPALVVIDTLAALTAGWVSDANDAAQWAPVMRDLAKIAREHDTAILLLAHATKQGTQYRGSTAIGAGVDAVLTMRAKGDDADPAAPSLNDDGLRTIAAKGRWPMQAFAVQFNGREYALVDGLMPLTQRVFDTICLLPGSSRNRIVETVAGRRQDILESINHLVATGRVVDRRGANNASALYPSGEGDALGQSPVSPGGSGPGTGAESPQNHVAACSPNEVVDGGSPFLPLVWEAGTTPTSDPSAALATTPLASTDAQ